MRTPAQIAHLLGWPEARSHIRYTCILCGWSTAVTVGDLEAVAKGHRDQEHGRRTALRIFRHAPGWWVWDVWGYDTGTAPSQPAALALGLAALETASVRSAR